MICRNCDEGTCATTFDKNKLTSEVGHMSKECPKPRDYSRVKCNNCGQMGHTVKRCNEPIKEQTDDWGSGGGTGGGAVGGWDNGGDATQPAGDWDNGKETTQPTGGWDNAGGEETGGFGGGGDWGNAGGDAPGAW